MRDEFKKYLLHEIYTRVCSELCEGFCTESEDESEFFDLEYEKLLDSVWDVWDEITPEERDLLFTRRGSKSPNDLIKLALEFKDHDFNNK